MRLRGCSRIVGLEFDDELDDEDEDVDYGNRDERGYSSESM